MHASDEDELKSLVAPPPDYPNTVMSYESLLSLIGIGKYHWGVILACGLSNGADAVEIVAISFVIQAAKDDLGMSSLYEGILTAIIFLGMMFGGWIWGSMADQSRFGRKKILFYSLLVNGIFGLLSVFTLNFYMLLVFRFCSGLGVGGSIPVTFTYAAEFLPKESRGFYLAMLAISWPVAATMTALFAYAIIPNIDTFYIGSFAVQSWRLFLIPCSIPAFAASFVFFKLVDCSPKWLIYTKHNYMEASKILVQIYKTNNNQQNPNSDDANLFEPNTLKEWAQQDMEAEAALIVNDDERDSGPIQARPAAETAKSSMSSVWNKTQILFNKQHRRSHILAGMVWLTLSYSFYGLAEWLPTYFGSINDVNEYTSTIATSAAQFPGAILTCWFVEYYCNRKATLSISIALGALTLIAIPYLDTGSEIVIVMCVFNGVTVCAWSALDVVSTELSPTNVRSTAYGFFSAMGRIGAIFGNVTFGLFGQDDIASALTLCGIVLVVGTVSCILLPSTKGVAIR